MSVLRPSLVLLGLFTALTGLIYPFLVTGVAQALFPDQANGSLIRQDGEIRGSRSIGQAFSEPRYFWSRPSATSPVPYNGASSSGSNQGPLNPALLDAVKQRVETLRAADPDNKAPVPVDLVTASGSGLDPDISLAAALYQVNRVAKTRGLESHAVEQLVLAHTEARALGLFGEPRVHVLELNLALDSLH